jgi:hypothetical protein
MRRKDAGLSEATQRVIGVVANEPARELRKFDRMPG